MIRRRRVPRGALVALIALIGAIGLIALCVPALSSSAAARVDLAAGTADGRNPGGAVSAGAGRSPAGPAKIRARGDVPSPTGPARGEDESRPAGPGTGASASAVPAGSRPTDAASAPAGSRPASPPPASAPPASAPPSAGPADGLGDGIDSAHTLDSGRTYQLHTDAPLLLGLDGPHRPLVILLHGLLNSADTMRATSWADPYADAHGFSVVYGQAVHGAWNAGPCCGGSTSDDLRYLRDVVADASRYTAVDPRRVYLWGFSNGGMMAARAACEAPDLFAAVGIVGAQVLTACPTVPVALMHIHGTADTTVPWRGGWSGYLRMTLPDGALDAERFRSGSVIRTVLWDGGHTWPWWAVGTLWDFSTRFTAPFHPR